MRKLLVLIVLAGCGGSSPAPQNASTDPEPTGPEETAASRWQCFTSEMTAWTECIEGSAEDCQAAAEEAQAGSDCFEASEVWCFSVTVDGETTPTCSTSEDQCAMIREMSVDEDIVLAEDCASVPTT